jgi:hypothetical protein
MNSNPIAGFLIFLILCWLAFLWLAKVGGYEKLYLKLSKSLGKAAAKPALNQVKKNKKFFWGIGIGVIATLYALSKINE